MTAFEDKVALITGTSPGVEAVDGLAGYASGKDGVIGLTKVSTFDCLLQHGRDPAHRRRRTRRRGALQPRSHDTRRSAMTNTIRTLRVLLLFEAATFLAAASIHFGALVEGYSHRKAGTAETVIAVVLLAGSALTWRSAWALRAAVVAQGFAILGVLVGLWTIAVGVGPRTVPDVVYHVSIVAVLVAGLALALRAQSRVVE